jgi:hypothetical protein
MPGEAGERDELLRLAAAGDGASGEALVDRSRQRPEILHSLGGDWLEP